MSLLKNILQVILLLVILGGGDLLGQQSARTDPFGNDNPLTKDMDKTKAIPDVVRQYAPSGSMLERVGFGTTVGSPGEPAIMEKILATLIQATRDTSNKPNIWTFAMVFSFFGMLLSGFLTFKAISAGQEQLGVGALKWVGKVAIILIMINMVASAMPVVLINMCDAIAGDKFATEQANTKEGEGAATAIGERQVAGWFEISKQWFLHSITTLNLINADGEGEGEGEGNNTAQSIADAYVEAIKAAGWPTGVAEQELEEAISQNKESATETLSEALDRVAKEQFSRFADTFTGEIRKNMQQQGASEETINRVIAPPKVNMQGISLPPQIIRTAAYVATFYIVISIWSLPIAILIWTCIFSLPKQWGMGDILYSGIKISIGVILTCLLVTIYINGTLTSEIELGLMERVAEASQKVATAYLKGSLLGVGKLIIGGDLGTETQFLNMGYILTGTTLPLLISSVLIITAPLQAAAIVKGGNGIAESAKTAMMAGGASYGAQQMVGEYGNFTPGGTPTAVGQTNISMNRGAFSSNLSPGKPS